jgi:hypothetical protein
MANEDTIGRRGFLRIVRPTHGSKKLQNQRRIADVYLFCPGS